MGELADDESDPASMLAYLEGVGGPGFDLIAAQLRVHVERARYPLNKAPLIVDLTTGPDATIALLCAAHAAPLLVLVITPEPDRARKLLDWCGRSDVAVVGADSPGLAGTVSTVRTQAEGPIRWAGTASAVTLARVLSAVPETAERLVVWQRAGDISWADPGAMMTVLATATKLNVLNGPVTADGAPVMRPGDDLHTALTTATHPWSALLRRELDTRFTQTPALALTATLTLTCGLRLPLVMFAAYRTGAGHRPADRRRLWVPARGEIGLDAFRRWILRTLTPDSPR